jgi:hypothetical protein
MPPKLQMLRRRRSPPTSARAVEMAGKYRRHLITLRDGREVTLCEIAALRGEPHATIGQRCKVVDAGGPRRLQRPGLHATRGLATLREGGGTARRKSRRPVHRPAHCVETGGTSGCALRNDSDRNRAVEFASTSTPPGACDAVQQGVADNPRWRAGDAAIVPLPPSAFSLWRPPAAMKGGYRTSQLGGQPSGSDIARPTDAGRPKGVGGPFPIE